MSLRISSNFNLPAYKNNNFKEQQPTPTKAQSAKQEYKELPRTIFTKAAKAIIGLTAALSTAMPISAQEKTPADTLKLQTAKEISKDISEKLHEIKGKTVSEQEFKKTDAFQKLQYQYYKKAMKDQIELGKRAEKGEFGANSSAVYTMAYENYLTLLEEFKNTGNKYNTEYILQEIFESIQSIKEPEKK